MKRKLFVVGVILAFHALGEMSDVEVREIVERSTKYCSPESVDSELRYAIKCCGQDTNRFVRILQQIAADRPELSTSMISSMCKYGNASCLSFLYQCTTNAYSGCQASWAILELEGVTSNSVFQVSRFISLPAADLRDRSSICRTLLSKASAYDVPQDLKSMVFDAVTEYATVSNAFSKLLDERLCRFRPAYANSKRRLSVLRRAKEEGIHPSQSSFVTNAINELVAYPEADLPE